MSVAIGEVRFKNPVMTASGTFAYGVEFSHLMDLNAIGGVVVKGISMEPIKGNPPPRIYETSSGMLNAIGWQNIGAIEDPRDTYKVTAQTRKASKRLPLWVKLSPNVTDIGEFARACEEAGAEAVSVVNTFVGMAIDVEKRRPRLRYVTGGLSGPAIKPLAVRMVWETCQAVKIPVIGVGGIATTEDALEFLLAGARAVQVGTANFYNPSASQQIALGLEEYCRSHCVEDINELVGALCV